jgi:hypothetical protein
MHERRIVLGHLRSENVITDKNRCPFSLSQYSRLSKFIPDFFSRTTPRSCISVASEQILRWNENQTVDVYSPAMILYEIATRHPMEESFSKGLSA